MPHSVSDRAWYVMIFAIRSVHALHPGLAEFNLIEASRIRTGGYSVWSVRLC